MNEQAATQGAAPGDPPASAPSVSTGSPGAGRRGGQQGSRAVGVARGLVFRYGLVVAFLVMLAVFSLLKPHVFPTAENAKAILEEAAPPAILAIGLTAVLVMNDFDLSFGSMVGVGSGLVTVLLVNHHVGWVLAVIIALLVGIAGGVVNGVLIAVLGGSSFIITLAMGTVLTGVEYAITKQADIFSGMPASFTSIAQDSSILGINNQVWIGLVIAIIVWLLLEKTEIGRFMYAIGGNSEAARLAGVRVRTLRILGFVIIGMAAIVAGVLITSLGGSYTPNPGPPYLLPAYAGVFLGAAAFRPGQFNVLGTVVGVLFLECIQTGLTMLSLSTWIINVVQGAILIAAVLLSRLGEGAA
jgi:ribose transport system permease protein